MKKSTKLFKKVSRKQVMKNNEPLTEKECKNISKEIDRFLAKMRKDNGGARYDNYTSFLISIATPKELITNLRGNMQLALTSMSSAINILVNNVAENMKMPRENILLYCITDLAEEVRKLWAEQSSPSTDVTKIPIEPIK